MGWTRIPVFRFTHQLAPPCCCERIGPDRRSLIPIISAHLTIRCLAIPAAAGTPQASHLGKRAIKE